MTRVAVIEDNVDLLDDICFHLTHAGFDVKSGQDGQQLDQLLEHFKPDIIILDLGLPGEDGLSITQRLRRSHPKIGLVHLTARAGIKNRITGHEAGADYYFTKPVDFEELLIVLYTLTRRLGDNNQRCHWYYCHSKLQLETPAQKVMVLTKAEGAIIYTLQQAHNHEASRKELIQALGGDWLSFDERRLETTISRLRKKITSISGEEAPLRALRGVGYRFLEKIEC